MINEKTRVTVSLATLLFVIVSTASFVYSFGNLKAEYDVAISELRITDLQTCNDVEEVKAYQATNRQLLMSQQTDLAEIKTDLKWIRAIMEKEE